MKRSVIQSTIRGQVGQAEEAVFRQLLPTLETQVPDPRKVRVLLAGDFAAACAAYQSDEVGREGHPPAVNYPVEKPDGSVVGGKTIATRGGDVIIIVPPMIFQVEEMARRTLFHEAQHVWLHHRSESAIAVHQQAPSLTIPDGLDWTFAWIAEVALDEFRCERALYDHGLAEPDAGDDAAAEWDELLELFAQVNTAYQQTHDLNAFDQQTFAALERTAVALAYAAARVVSGDDGVKTQWSRFGPAGEVAATLQPVPNARIACSPEALTSAAFALAGQLRGILNAHGRIDIYPIEGGHYIEPLF